MLRTVPFNVYNFFLDESNGVAWISKTSLILNKKNEKNKWIFKVTVGFVKKVRS